MNNLFKNLVIWLVIGLVLMTVFNQFNTRQQTLTAMDYSQFIEEVKAGRIGEVVIEAATSRREPPTANLSPVTPPGTSGWSPICSSMGSRSRPSPKKSNRC